MKNSLKFGAVCAALLCSALALAQSATPAGSPAPMVGNAKAGQDKIAMCVGCHGIPGYKASYPEVYEVPKIGDQNAKYIENALHEYKSGERKHPTMHSVAIGLSDQDMADVAAYYSQVK